MINIIIADDHEIVVEGLISLIKPEDGIRIVGEANNGEDVIPLLEKGKVDIAVLDINMPIMDGIELTTYIKKNFPKVKVLVLTMHDDLRFIRRTIEVGVQGYILKNKGKEEFVTAIKTINSGEDYFGEKVTKALISSHRSEFIEGEIVLTKKEKEILKLIAKGYSTPEIAEQLCRANTTIDSHRRNLIEKTGVKNSKALIRFAFENGYT